MQAKRLGLSAIGIADNGTLAGVVRAYRAAKEHEMPILVGARVDISCAPLNGINDSAKQTEEQDFSLRVIIYPTSRSGYHQLSKLLSTGKLRNERDRYTLYLDDLQVIKDCHIIAVPPLSLYDFEGKENKRQKLFLENCGALLDLIGKIDLLSIAITKNYLHQNKTALDFAFQAAHHLGVKPVATNDVHYHLPERRELQDVLTCIRHQTTIEQAGRLLYPNSERHLKSPTEMARLFREYPECLNRTIEITEQASGFCLDQLKYEYPDADCPAESSPFDYLVELTNHGAKKRYPEGIPEKIKKLLLQEFELIKQLGYEKYFLTCYDIVRFARSKNILCQGRGAAANSAVCFCLEITSVDPAKIDLLFARFVSKERDEPPDIDIDFEHERREEVIQYIYERYGRDHAALTSVISSFQHRSALREVAKAFGLPLAAIDLLTKSIHRWTGCKITPEILTELGFCPDDFVIKKTLILSRLLKGFPRHFSQHVGGFIISAAPLSELVPIGNAGMENRTIIEWNKDDIEELGILKIDVLALGMLTCIRKALDLINLRRMRENRDQLALHTVPQEDSAVYDMICRADTLGVFQIESRAQMSMLPRLRPRTFYDLVIEVAIVRPGPIQGNMVHPYLKRRSGLEKPYYPDKTVEEILGKTLGVPLFQEQAMRLAIALAGFTPGEAERLRRSIAAWKTKGKELAFFEERVITGMKNKGYNEQFARTCFDQMKGFSEYGFPESHAASFALLVYVSAWIKHYYPAEFAAALINSQPMGFYAPSQITKDAQDHGVKIEAIDINQSEWDCTVSRYTNTVRLGMRLIRGLSKLDAQSLVDARRSYGKFASVQDAWNKAQLIHRRFYPGALRLLARADAFKPIGISRRQTLWEIRALPKTPHPLEMKTSELSKNVNLPEMSDQQEMFEDYKNTSLSLKAHPINFIRAELEKLGVKTAKTLKNSTKTATKIMTAGIVLFRQRPRTASGVVFITIEDETGVVNLIIKPKIFNRFQREVIMSSSLLITGKLERSGEVVYILVETVASLDQQVLEERKSYLPSRSYSY